MKSALNFWAKWQSLLPVLLVVLLFLSYDLHRSYLREITFAQRHNENIARVLEGHLSSCIDRIDLALSNALVEFGPLLSTPPRSFAPVNVRLKQILDKIPESQSLRIVDASGHVISDASGELPLGDISDRQYFIRNRDEVQAGLVISEPIWARFTQNWVITISRSFRDRQGKFLGLIQAAVRADYFDGFYHTLNMGPHGLIVLMNQDLVLFARHPSLPTQIGMGLPDSDLRHQLLENHPSGHYLTQSPFDGVPRFVYFRKATPTYPFIFLVGAARSDVFAELYWKAFIYGIFMVLLLGATCYIISGWRHRHRDALALAERMSQNSQRQTERLTAIIDATQVGTWEWNIQTGELIINERWANILGFHLDELQPISIHTWLGRCHPEDLKHSDSLLEQHFSNQIPYYSCEMRLRHRAGHWVWVLSRGQVSHWTTDQRPLWMFGTQQDISTPKALEFSLKELLEDHERLVQNIPVGVYRYHMHAQPQAEADCFNYVSPQWCAQMSLTAAEVLHNPRLAFHRIHPQDRASLVTALRNARQQLQPFFWEGRLLSAGVIRWVRVESTPSRLPNGDILWNGIQSDVTERILARQAQERATALRQALLDNSAVGVFLATWNRQIEQVSHRIGEMFGYSAEELIGHSSEIIHTDHAHFEQFAAQYQQLKFHHRVDLEYPFRHRNGRVFWCAVTGIPLDRQDANKGIVWTFLDIDEKRHLAAELEMQRHSLSEILNCIPAAVSYWDARDAHNIYNVFSNRTYADWYETTPEALKGIHVRTLLGEKIYNEYWHRMEAARRGEAQMYNRYQPAIHGHPCRYAQVHYIPNIRDGVPQGIYVMMFDTTLLHESEQALKQAKELAEEASRAKGSFLANMSHEIRTPMNAVLGLLELLQYTELNRRQRDYAEKAHTAAKALLGILNDILDFSKVEAGKLELENTCLDLEELLSNLSVVLSAANRNKKVEVIFDLDATLPSVMRGDPLRLQQILLNLAGNAVKFTQQGSVVLRLRRCPAQQPDRIALECSVEDTGIGIAPSKLERIFEGFSQAETSTTRHYGGTGLGLAISQRLVHLMGGELKVESTLGQGSRFYFTLELEQDLQPAPPRLSTASQGLSVLVVDDNPLSREVLSGMARTLGWTAQAVGSGTEALACLTPSTEQPTYQLILVDHLMPEMDGWETAGHIRSLKSPHPLTIILMTNPHDLDQLEPQNQKNKPVVDGFLVKPITLGALRNSVADLLQNPDVNPTRPLRTSEQRLAGLHLLVVEDNAINQRVAQGLLSHEGARVQVVGSGRSGLAAIDETTEPFDAVLMDIQMPDMDGYEVTRRLRQTWTLETLPIIAMTANAMPSDRAECLAAGMNDHISKPIDLNVLVETLLRYCKRPQTQTIEPSTALAALPTQASTSPSFPEGFNPERALARLDHDTHLYASLVHTFCQDQQQCIANLRELLQQGQIREAGRLLHTLRGLAATLGAERLSQEAGQTEKAIRDSLPPEHIEHLLTRLAPYLTEALQVLTHLAETLPPSASSVTDQGTQPDPARILDLLLSLDQLLAEYNMKALDVFTTLTEESRDMLKDNLHALEEAMRRLDFVAAREKVANLIALMKLKYA